jgi:hypothetical protein
MEEEGKMKIEVCDECESDEDLFTCISCIKGDEVYCEDCFKEHVVESHSDKLADDHWKEYSEKVEK